MSTQLSNQLRIVQKLFIDHVWINKKTQKSYTILSISQCATNGREEEIDVIYQPIDSEVVYNREASEFFIKFHLDDTDCKEIFEAIQ